MIFIVMQRRDVLKKATLGAAATTTLAAPAIVRAQQRSFAGRDAAEKILAVVERAAEKSLALGLGGWH